MALFGEGDAVLFQQLLLLAPEADVDEAEFLLALVAVREERVAGVHAVLADALADRSHQRFQSRGILAREPLLVAFQDSSRELLRVDASVLRDLRGHDDGMFMITATGSLELLGDLRTGCAPPRWHLQELVVVDMLDPLSVDIL